MPDTDTHVPDTLGSLLDARRESLGWSYAELTRRSGVPRNTVHSLLTGSMPRVGTDLFTHLARAMGIPAREIGPLLYRAHPAEKKSPEKNPV